jgi:hypothetical protein
MVAGLPLVRGIVSSQQMKDRSEMRTINPLFTWRIGYTNMEQGKLIGAIYC